MLTATQRASADQDTTGEMANAADQFRAQTRRAKEDVRQAANVMKDDARQAANVMKNDIETIAHHAGRQFREYADIAEKDAVHAYEVVKGKIQDEPLKSSLIALGVGLVLGFLFRRA